MIEIIAIIIMSTVTSSCGYLLGYAAARRRCIHVIRDRFRSGGLTRLEAVWMISRIDNRLPDVGDFELDEGDAP